jgi:hypothetical protein
MANRTRQKNNGAILESRVAFFVFCLFLPMNLAAEVAWFNAKGLVGDHQREYSVVMTSDSVPLYKGSQRRAPEMIVGQTFWAQRFCMQGQQISSDTVYSWNSELLFRNRDASGGVVEPIWIDVVRSSLGQNEWTRIQFGQNPIKVDFHSQIYGDGSHALNEIVLPEESLIPLAIRLIKNPAEIKFHVMAPMAERPYERRQFMVSGVVTEQKLVIDEVEAVLVRFEREDGAIAEAWVSTKGFRLLRFKSFQGTWLERIQ